MSTIRKIPGKNPLSGLYPKTLSPEAEAVHRKLVITNRLIELMEEQGVSRSELAKRMGVQPSRVTAMLSGTSNLTIDTLVRAGMALGAELHQTFVPIGTQVKWGHETPASDFGTSLTSRVAEDPTPYRVKKSK
jgi:transcriptional regulator with XRE-family HTH domain